MLVHDLLLPVFERDPSFVLLAGAVLGEEAGPMVAVARHHDAPLPLDHAHAVHGADVLDGLAALSDQPGPRVRTRDAQRVPAAVRLSAEAPVSQVEAE